MTIQHTDDTTFERELPGETVTLRSTVDEIGGEVWSCFAAEPSKDTLRQIVRPMTRDDWLAVIDMGEASVRAIDRLTVGDDRRVA